MIDEDKFVHGRHSMLWASALQVLEDELASETSCCTSDSARYSKYFLMDWETAPQNCLIPWGLGPPKMWFLGCTGVHTPNGISTCSAFCRAHS